MYSYKYVCFYKHSRYLNDSKERFPRHSRLSRVLRQSKLAKFFENFQFSNNTQGNLNLYMRLNYF